MAESIVLQNVVKEFTLRYHRTFREVTVAKAKGHIPPGAPGDMIARLIQPALQKELGQPVIVDNRPGAGGNIGAQEVARSTDGHTVLVGPDTLLALSKAAPGAAPHTSRVVIARSTS